MYDINHTGYINSIRQNINGKAPDGMTYFGTSLKGENGKIINDIILPIEKTKKISSFYYQKHFCIKYKEESDNYWVKDYGVGFGIFSRVTKS